VQNSKSFSGQSCATEEREELALRGQMP
jgi:hypothetical protein